jgi:hypothetical protein
MAAGTGPIAEKKALTDAKRNALEQACGVFIDSKTISEKYELLDDRILSNVRGYVLDVTPPRTWTENGITYCEITATVGMDNLRKDWQSALRHKIAEQGYPRCMIIITEDDDPQTLPPAAPDGACAHGLEKIFRDNGIRLVDKVTLDDVTRKDMDAAALRGDVGRLAASAGRFGAELLVYGNAEANALPPVSVGGHNVYRWKLTANIRIVHSDTGDIVASDTYPDEPYLHQSLAHRCGKEGFTKLASEVGPRLLQDYIKNCQPRHKVYQVFFVGCTLDAFRDTVMPALQRLDGVRQNGAGVLQLDASPGEIMTEVYWMYDLDALAVAIAHLDIDGMSFEQTEQSGSRIRFKVHGCR